MSKLELFYPAKPYKITQAFGINNPSYLQFGFSQHNGIDFLIDADGMANAMCDGVVYEVGFNAGAGTYVRYKTNVPVEVEGRTAHVAFMYMHAEKALVKVGQQVTPMTPLIIADNTGFSTGPHTHISAYLIDSKNAKMALDPKSDHCFDFAKYYNGYHAVDSEKVMTILYGIVDLLKTWLKLSTPKP